MMDISLDIAALVTAFGTAIPSILGATWARQAKREVKPNHGSSLRDVADDLKGEISILRIQVDALGERLHLVDDKVDSLGHQFGEHKRDTAHDRARVDAALEGLAGGKRRRR